MNTLTVIYFFSLILLLGYSLRSLFKIKLEHFWQDIILNLGLGLAVFPIIGVILNTLFIPLTWYFFLLISLIVPIKDIITKKNWFFLKDKSYFSKEMLPFLLLIMVFFAHLALFIYGSYAYPYLEDGDPYVHAEVADYISNAKTYSLSQADALILHYTEPYPPLYGVLNGILHQIDPDLMGILKIFNSMVISLGILFFFLLARKIFNSSWVALFAAFLLAAIPSYLSHFIFSTGFALTLFFPALYFLITLDEQLNWKKILAGSIICSGAFLVQPIAAAMFLVLTLFILLFKMIFKQPFYKDYVYCLGGGLLLSQIYWIPTFVKFGIKNVANKMGFGMFVGGAEDSSGGVIYSFKDYFFSPLANKIDQATGFGWMIFILMTIAIIFLVVRYKTFKERKNEYLFAFSLYALLTFILTESNAFPYKFVPHRIWVYLSIAVVVLATYGFIIVWNSFKNKFLKGVILTVIIILIYLSSVYPKYVVQTAKWPSEIWGSNEEMGAFLWMKDNLAVGTKVIIGCPSFEGKISAFNLEEQSWKKEVRDFKSNFFNLSNEEVLFFLHANKYQLIVFDSSCFSPKLGNISERVGDLKKDKGLNLLVQGEKIALFSVR